MSIDNLKPGGMMDNLKRGDATVFIPLTSEQKNFAACLRSVLSHTPATVRVVIGAESNVDPSNRAFVKKLETAGHFEHQISWLTRPELDSPAQTLNALLDACAPADVVVLDVNCEVAEGWFEGLRETAYSDSLAATASAVTNIGELTAWVGGDNAKTQLPQDLSFQQAAELVRESSLRLRPRVPSSAPTCYYIRRSAIELVGELDEENLPTVGAEIDFAQRCLKRGLQHLVADDVLVLFKGSETSEKPKIKRQQEEIVSSRSPYLHRFSKQTHGDPRGPLSRAQSAAAAALGELTVTVDGRCLGPGIAGIQVHTLEVIHALWRRQEGRIRVLLPGEVGEYALEVLSDVNGIELVHGGLPAEGAARDHVVHRPFQVTSDHDLQLLSACARRSVISHHDLILYRNPSYFSSYKNFESFRRLTKRTMSLADMVVFGSQHAADDAMADDLLPPSQVAVIPSGVDHQLASLEVTPVAPHGMADLADGQFLLCLGTDFSHKNRPFALRVLHSLRERHGWEGRLVFAGPQVTDGSSQSEEAQWLALHPETANRVTSLSSVAEAEKAWLYQHATAVIYPTTYEGFGLVPFEAAAANTPCLWAPVASLANVLSDATATIVPWDADATSDRVIKVLSDVTLRKKMVKEVQTIAKNLTWDSTAEQLFECYRKAIVAPARRASWLAANSAQLQAEFDAMEASLKGSLEETLAQLEATKGELNRTRSELGELEESLGSTGMALVGPDGWLPDQAQRTIAGLARRKVTRRPLLAVLSILYSLSGNQK